MNDFRKLFPFAPLLMYFGSMPLTMVNADGPGFLADADGFQGYEIVFLLPLLFLIEPQVFPLALGLCFLSGLISMFLYLGDILFDKRGLKIIGLAMSFFGLLGAFGVLGIGKPHLGFLLWAGSMLTVCVVFARRLGTAQE